MLFRSISVTVNGVRVVGAYFPNGQAPDSDKFVYKIVQELENLWSNRTRHGANRQKFGKHQENLLDKIVRRMVPKEEQPFKDAPLKIDSKFATYCKAIVWNGQKSMGKKITREKSIRSGMVSLSEFDYLQN